MICVLKLFSFLSSLQQLIFGSSSYYGNGVIVAILVVTTAPFGKFYAIIASLLSASGLSIQT